MKVKLSHILIGIAVVVAGVVLYVSSQRLGDDVLRGSTKVKVQLQWFPQTQFAGLYVAVAKGFYQDQGLDVEIIPGGPQISPLAKVINGDADICLATADQALIERANGKKVRAVGTVFKNSLACFMSKQSAKINSPKDLVGKTVGVYFGFDTENILLSLLKVHQVDPKKVKMVAAGASLEPFYSDQWAAFPAYRINEPFEAEKRGVKVSLLKPEQFGVLFYSDTFLVSDDTLSKKREMVAKFLKASQKGWEYARAHQEEAVDIVLRVASSQSMNTKDVQTAMLKESLNNINTGAEHPCMFAMEKQTWTEMERWLREIGKLNGTRVTEALCDFDIAEER